MALNRGESVGFLPVFIMVLGKNVEFLPVFIIGTSSFLRCLSWFCQKQTPPSGERVGVWGGVGRGGERWLGGMVRSLSRGAQFGC